MLSDSSKLAHVAKEIDTLDVLGLADIRRVGSGDEQLQFGHY